ncbi:MULTISPECIES: HAD family hydrolase [Ruminococcus]|uniref:Phosphoglycolate phosphatase n=1 Tax=Ruminococcus flavefaciens TaxID=1265 RepID=A0A1M7JP38_RUMFL|nr:MULTISPECIES: HAD family hydrolase [Ruminococcus]MCR4796481.1 HAD family hydrolase [Ruminococcus sp.]SHM54782.1 phosphoglycolate phosphatase [Ruminococcus flavefaciens]
MKTAVFDLDGTIADTICDLGDAVNYGLERLGCPTHDYEAYKKMVGNGAKKLCERALPEDKKDKSAELHKLFKEYYSQHYLDKTKLYDGMKETMEKLQSRGVVLAVATNKPEDVAREIIWELLPDIGFVKVLGGVDYRPVKPDSAILIEIFSVLPDEENEVYMIGDSNVDIRTAKNAGIASIGCAWGFRGREELAAEGADFIAEKPSDIADIIL